MKFKNLTGRLSVDLAISSAEKLLKPTSALMFEIRAKNDFKYDSGSGENVWYKLQNGPENVEVKFYTPWNPFTRAIAMTNGDGCIYLNWRKFKSRSLDEIVGTLLHEYSHLCGFKHGNNYKTKEKCEYSVPYFLSENVMRFL